MSEEKEEKMKVEVNSIAYKKIVFHCLRYPSSKVYGLLVGCSASNISDAYPLFHSAIVNPTLSVAMDLVESNLPNNLKIQGFYEFIMNQQLKLHSIFQANPVLKPLIPMRVWVDDQEKEIRLGSKHFAFAYPEFQTIKNDLANAQHRLIVDFDAHFEEIQLDFRNLYVQ